MLAVFMRTRVCACVCSHVHAPQAQQSHAAFKPQPPPLPPHPPAALCTATKQSPALQLCPPTQPAVTPPPPRFTPPSQVLGYPQPPTHGHIKLAELCPRYFLFIFGAVRIMEQGCLLARV